MCKPALRRLATHKIAGGVSHQALYGARGVCGDMARAWSCGECLEDTIADAPRLHSKRKITQAGNDAVDGVGTASSSKLVVEGTALRGCATHAVCISVAMLSIYGNRRVRRCIIGAVVPNKHWRTAMSILCRSVDGSV